MTSRIDRAKSRAAFARAKNVIPGGVNSPARAFGAVGGEPPFIARGAGPFIYDIDGNEYIDFVGSWGPLILGHAHPSVIAAVEKALRDGSTFGAPTERETELAELIMACVPSIEMVRLVSSGTEAAMSAIRLARGFTGRDMIVKFAGCYHGHVDSLLVQAGSSALTHGVPTSPGVPAGCTRDTIVLPFNDPTALHDLFSKRGDQIAGVIIEPYPGNMGVIHPSPDFVDAIRELTTQHGAVLILDEVMTGFRLSLGGAQQLLGIQPDITVLGKIVGGGLPLAAYGGRRDIMARVMPSGPVFQAGTLSGNPLAVAAGVATLQQIRDDPPYEKLEALGRRLENGFRLPGTTLNRIGSMWTLFFTSHRVSDYESAKTSDTARFAKFFWAMMDRDIYLPCSQYEAAFISAAHDETIIDRTIAAMQEAFVELQG